MADHKNGKTHASGLVALYIGKHDKRVFVLNSKPTRPRTTTRTSTFRTKPDDVETSTDKVTSPQPVLCTQSKTCDKSKREPRSLDHIEPALIRSANLNRVFRFLVRNLDHCPGHFINCLYAVDVLGNIFLDA